MDHPEKESPDYSDEMNADELAAFEKIMGEIEGRGEQTTEEPDLEPEEDAAAELEIVTQDPDAAEPRDPAEAQRDDGADELDEEQQKALESIMAQIEGRQQADDGGGLAKEPADEPDPEPVEDTSAELEIVTQDPDPVEPRDPAEAQRDDGADELDEEQQKALESIMAQIEGRDTADRAANFSTPTDSAPETEQSDDFSAELEKVVEQAKAAASSDSTAEESRESAEPLDKEQAQASGSAMTPLVDKHTEQADSDDLISVTTAPDPEQETDDPAEIRPAGQNDSATASPADDSTDIDAILKAIASSDEKTAVTRTPGHGPPNDPDSAPARSAGPGASMAEKDIPPVSQSGPEPDGADLTQCTPPPTQKEPSPELKDYAAKANASGPPIYDPEPLPAVSQAGQSSSSLPETHLAAQPGKKRLLVIVTGLFLVLTMTGYLYGPAPTVPDSRDPSTTVHDAQPGEPAVVVKAVSDEARVKATIESLDRLRSELIEKRNEIEALRTYYQAGIDAEIQSIAKTIRTTGRVTMAFTAATADPRIGLGLSAIQRRETTIKKLQSPINTLTRSSEELLYFSRRAGLLALMAAKTSDIDIDGFINQADQIRLHHANELAQLTIDTVSASARSLESIWQDIARRLPAIMATLDRSPSTVAVDNATIWEKICVGDFSGKHQLTALSPQAARCLAAWKGKDLFLNGLSELSAEAARQLATWNGEWIGLNGLKELSPEAAMELVRWKGKGLSLNGLSQLSPRVVAILSEWQGDQIELVNVKHMPHWENSHTRLFLSEDLNRKRSTARN